ncbi:class I SAM-dependent methyltransferase [soil metagenome]
MTQTRNPDTQVWTDLAPVPSTAKTRLMARIARRLFVNAVSRLDVTVDLEGRSYGRGGPSMQIHDATEFFTRLGVHRSIGFGESYLTGSWDAEDLGGFLAVLASEMADLVPRPLQKLRGVVMARPPRHHHGETKDTQRNIAHHYDLSNDLFSLFLDESMTYSAAKFPSPQAGLDEAQIAKIDALLDLAGVAEGTRLLEIGTGWGALAIRAAQRGAQVRTLTLSVEQAALAQQRVDAAGLTDRVTIDICDYRLVSDGHEGEQYDAVVSVEMIEAVGWRHWSTYFRTVDRVLAPGGKFAIQAITMPHDRMLVTRHTYTWVHKYIFPGGFLPSIEVLDELTRRDTTLRLTDQTSLRLDYVETLRMWDERFTAAADDVTALGFDETFLRMWHFYLEYSRAGFASGYLDDYQLLFTREGR